MDDNHFYNLMFTQNNIDDMVLNKLKWKISICENNPINLKRFDLTKTRLLYNNPYFTVCTTYNVMYLACITKPNNVHICAVYLIAIGSNLDLRLKHQALNYHLNNNGSKDGNRRNRENEKIACNTIDLCNCVVNENEYKMEPTFFQEHDNFSNDIEKEEHIQQCYVERLKNNHILYVSNDNEDNNKYKFDCYQERFYNQLYGYYKLRHCTAHIPYILMNNRENIHKIKNKCVNKFKMSYGSFKMRSTKSIEQNRIKIQKHKKEGHIKRNNQILLTKYFYNNKLRGNVFKFFNDVVGNETFIHRNHLGVDFLNSVDNLLDTYGVHDIDLKHLDIHNIPLLKRLFKDISPHLRNIDTLSNKIILSPGLLLEKLINMIDIGDIKRAVKIIYSGNWFDLCSSTSNFVTSSQSYRKQTVEQPSLLRVVDNFSNINNDNINTNDAINGKKNQSKSNLKENINMDYVSNVYKKTVTFSRDRFLQVSRASSSSVLNQIIPSNANGFLCPIDRGTNIDSFNKQYVLLSNVHIYTKYDLAKLKMLTMNEIIDKLKLQNIITYSNSIDKKKGDKIYRIAVNGGIPTKYNIDFNDSFTFFKFFLMIKQYNQFIEVIQYPKWIFLNNIYGIPFKKCNVYDNLVIFFSPYELEKYFSNFSSFYDLFCPLCPQIVINNLEYLKLCKILHSLNYLKKAIIDVKLAPLSIFTESNCNWYQYLNQQTKNKTNSNVLYKNKMTLKTIIMTEPLCTQDGYLMNSKCLEDQLFFFIKKYSISIVYENNFKIIMNHDCLNFNVTPCSDDSYFIFICEIQNRNKNLNILKNPKISISTYDMGNNNYSHYIYIHIFRNTAKLNNHNIYCSSYIHNNILIPKQSILEINVFCQFYQSHYDGKKITDFYGSKGLINEYLNFDEKYQHIKDKIDPSASSFPGDLIVSPSSILSRLPIPQISSILKQTKDRQSLSSTTNAQETNNNPKIVYGNMNFNILKNASFEHLNTSLMRFDNNTNNMLNINKCPMTTYELLQQSHNEQEKYKIMPQNSLNILEVLLVLRKNITFNIPENDCCSLKLLD
ncbi:MAG: RNA polymerase subunit lef-8 [Cotesia congregata filamentous virus 2]